MRSGGVYRHGDGHILIVEDTHDVARVLQWALEDEGYAVELAGNGREAIRKAGQHVPSLVLLDLWLPLLSGEQVAQRLHALYDGIPIVLMTAAARGGEVADRIGARAALVKPFDIGAVIDLVHRILADERVAE